MENESCSNCKFYDEPYNQCRRFPPQFFYDHDSSASSFPGTSKTQWCGEWQSIEMQLSTPPYSEQNFHPYK